MRLLIAKGVEDEGLGKESSFANESIFPYRSAAFELSVIVLVVVLRSRGRSFSVAGQKRFWGDKHGQGNKRILLGAAVRSVTVASQKHMAIEMA